MSIIEVFILCAATMVWLGVEGDRHWWVHHQRAMWEWEQERAMSTWHQNVGMPKLYHAELYTVVNDPPHGTLTVTRFRCIEDAQRYADKTGGYVLPPSKERA